MLSTSQRQESVYTLTNRLMGDPIPNREQLSEALKAKVQWSPSPQLQVRHRKHLTGKERVLQAVQAIDKGATTSDMVSTYGELSKDMANNYLKRAMQWGWLRRSFRANQKCGGRVYVYEITDAGRAELERVR